jgi:hypothetical protein
VSHVGLWCVEMTEASGTKLKERDPDVFNSKSVHLAEATKVRLVKFARRATPIKYPCCRCGCS